MVQTKKISECPETLFWYNETGCDASEFRSRRVRMIRASRRRPRRLDATSIFCEGTAHIGREETDGDHSRISEPHYRGQGARGLFAGANPTRFPEGDRCIRFKRRREHRSRIGLAAITAPCSGPCEVRRRPV